MTKPIKSIFDKSYIVEAQAVKAGEKEWPQGAPFAKLSFDEATRKYRWVPCTPKVDELPTNVDLGQALAESGETLEDLKKGDVAANGTMDTAFVMPTHCPHCEINLENGWSHHEADVNGKLTQHDAFEYICLGCGGEFGPAINAKKERPRLSRVIRPTKMVWDIADSMPKASRKEVMEACVAAGIAYGTSRTQYQAWFKASQEAKRDDIRQPYEKGEK